MCTKTLLLFGGVGGGMAIYTYAGQKVDQFYFNPKKKLWDEWRHTLQRNGKLERRAGLKFPLKFETNKGVRKL